MPNLNTHRDGRTYWNDQRNVERYRNAVVKMAEKQLHMHGLSASIEAEKIITPYVNTTIILTKLVLDGTMEECTREPSTVLHTTFSKCCVSDPKTSLTS